MIHRSTIKLTRIAATVVIVGGAWALVRAQEASEGAPRAPDANAAPAPANNRGGLISEGPDRGRFVPATAAAPPGAVVRPVPNVPGAAPYTTRSSDGWVTYAVPGGVPAEHDPEMAKLAESEAELAQNADQALSQYTAADKPEDQKRLKSELRDALAKQFDVQRQRRELELKRIEERVQKLRDQIKKRNDARETIIDRRLDQLTNEAEGLGWGQPAGNPNARPPANFYRETAPRAK